DPLPGVAPSSQPQALGRNPFGIRWSLAFFCEIRESIPMETSGGLASDLTRCWIAAWLVDARSVLECAAAAALSIPPSAPAPRDPEKHTAANAPPQRVV